MGEAPVLEMHPQPTRDVFLSITSLPVGNQSEPYRIAVHPVAASNGPLWIYVATSLSQVNAATNDLAWSLAIALPVLLGFLALTISLSVGRSLRPIESIRVQALAMGVDLHQRVPVPRSRDEVSRLAVTVNQMLDRLEHAAQKQKQFVGDASHELRSPLASLRAEVEVELAQSDHAGVLSTLERVQLQAVRMTDLIEDLLFLARLHEGHSRQSFESVDLDEVVIDELRRLKALNKVEVSIGQLDAVRTLGSPRDLARLVRNIGDNALRHAATEVEIELADHGDSATITIANDGPPIPPEDRQRIFDRFTRLDGARSRRIGGGVSGLGLAIAQEIATAHGGHISVLTRQNETAGVTFVVTLPITQDDRIHP